MNKNQQIPCSICNNFYAVKDTVPGILLRDSITRIIKEKFSEWSKKSYICKIDLNKYRGEYIRRILESEKGELTSIDQKVLSSLQDYQIISTQTDLEFDKNLTYGEKLADRIATFGGSWTFLILFGIAIFFWIFMNSVIFFTRPIDPYPYILLNLMLSFLAAIQAPVIMMSQNRKEAKDRIRSQHDYQVNLKAELEIRNLHEKIDHLLSHQWEHLVEIQEVQLDLLSELSYAKNKNPHLVVPLDQKK